MVAAEGFEVGLLATAFGFGLRHGIDWDHLAAITDITSSQEDGKRSVFLAGLYAVGHALVVLVLGVLAIAAGDRLPEGIDAFMGRVVGATLVLLGAYVFWALARDGRDFRLRSRWMLVLDGASRLTRRLRHVVVEHDHDHPADGHHHDDHHEAPAGVDPSPVRVAHAHVHRHVGTVPDDPFRTYGWRTALGVGALHGVGAETPTQVLLFVAAAGVAGTGGGILMLLAFVAGLFATNTAIALLSTFGFLQAGRNWRAYMAVAVVTGAASLVLGVLLLLGQDAALPALF